MGSRQDRRGGAGNGRSGYEPGPLPGFVDKSAKIIYYFHNFHEERAHHV